MEHAHISPARTLNFAPASDEAHGTPNATGPKDQQTQADFAERAGRVQGDKVLATPCAELALRGYSLSCTDSSDRPMCVQVSRWGLVTELRDVAAIAAFARRAGIGARDKGLSA